MELDTKQKVLLAIYMEYQKDVPDMLENITSKNLGIGEVAFEVALEKLENEELITGAVFQLPLGGGKHTRTADIMMTREGIEYVENRIGIEKTLSGIDKLKYIVKKTAELGWDQAKDLAARTMADIAKPQ
jgi:hypothetical protein